MNNGAPIRILVLGPDYSGKTTLAGHFLYKCGKLGPEMREILRKQVDEGKEPNQWAESLCVKDSDMFFFPRFYRSPKYEVIVADSTSINFFPDGHQAVCVVLLVDASQWEFENSMDMIQKQLFLISHLGVKHIVVCVNKMDLTQPPYSQQRYDFIQQEVHSCIQVMEKNGFAMGTVDFLPISALAGDNLQEASPQTPWFKPKTIEGRAGGTLIGITLHQLLCSFSNRKPRGDPLSACPDLYNNLHIRALTPKSMAAQASVHHQPRSSGPSGGLRDDPPKELDAQQGAASAAGGGLGAGKAGGPSGIVAGPSQETLLSFSTLMPFVTKTCHQQDPSSSSSLSSSLSNSSLQLTQATPLPLLCVPYQGLVSEAPPGPSWATQPAFLPIVNQPPSSSHQHFPSLLPFQNSFGQDQHPGAQNSLAPFVPLFLMPAHFYVHPLAAPQQPSALGPWETLPPPLPLHLPLLPPLPPPLSPPLCPFLHPPLPLPAPVPPPYSPPPPYTSPRCHPPDQPFPQPQGPQPEALPQAQTLALPPGWLTEDPEAEFPPEPIFPPSLALPSPFQPSLFPVEYPPRPSP